MFDDLYIVDLMFVDLVLCYLSFIDFFSPGFDFDFSVLAKRLA